MGSIQSWFLVSIVALGLSAHVARAGDDWCDKPLVNICQGNSAAQRRVKGLEEFQKAATARAKARAERELGPAAKDPVFGAPLLFTWTLIYMQSELAREAEIWEELLAAKPMSAIQGYVLDAIEEEFAQGNLDHATYKGMLEKAGAVVHVRAAALYKTFTEDKTLMASLNAWMKSAAQGQGNTSELPETAALIVALVTNCGLGGTVANAFLHSERGTKYIFYCPAQILMNAALAGDDYDAFEVSLQMMAHEIGHAIEDEFPEAYTDMNACFTKNYGKRVRATGSYVLETGADFWAGRALEIYLRRIDSLEIRREAAARALAWMCTGDTANVSNTDSGRHPPIDVRMDSMFLNSESVRELLGCAPRADKTPGCGLAGAR